MKKNKNNYFIMDIVSRKIEKNKGWKYQQPIGITDIFDIQKQTHQVLEYIQETTGKSVLGYKKKIVHNLASIESSAVLGQQDYFRFTVWYLLRNNIQTWLRYNDYATYVLEKNTELRRKEELEWRVQLSKSIHKAQALYEALAPIHNRLIRIKLFFDNLERYDKLAKQTKFKNVYDEKIIIIDSISKQLINDKLDLQKLEADEKYMRAEEKIIMEAAKKSYKLYMLQIYKQSPETKKLFNDWSHNILIYDDYQWLEQLFNDTVTTSEDFWVFHEKFFSILIRLWLRKERRKKKR